MDRPALSLEQLREDPHPALARLREREPVAWVPELGGWLITRYEDAQRVMRDPAGFTVDDPRFSTARVVGPSMLSLDGSPHDRHREPFRAPFASSAVRESFTALVRRHAERLLDELLPAGGGDLRRSYAAPLAAVIAMCAVGLDPSAADEVLAWYAAIVDAVDEITTGHAVPAAGLDASAQLRTRLGGVLRRHEGQPGAPESILEAAAAAGTLSQKELVSNAAVILFGGIETTEGMIAGCVLALLGHPDQVEAMRGEETLVSRALEESLRLEPAAAIIDRYAVADAVLAGVSIRAGDLVRISIAAANRDPEVFPDPDRFDLTRPPGRGHLAFAQGPHACLGVHLARLEAVTAVSVLLERAARLRLDPERPSHVRGLVFRKPQTLHALWS